MILQNQLINYLNENLDHNNDSKVFLLYLHSELKNKPASDELNNQVLEKLKNMLPMGDWYSYCLNTNNKEDFFDRLKQIVYEASHLNILDILKKHSDLESDARQEEDYKLYLIDFLTNNINEKDYDMETKDSLSQLYELIISGEIQYVEDMSKYGLIL
jgi:hypothetical protein